MRLYKNGGARLPLPKGMLEDSWRSRPLGPMLAAPTAELWAGFRAFGRGTTRCLAVVLGGLAQHVVPVKSFSLGQSRHTQVDFR